MVWVSNDKRYRGRFAGLLGLVMLASLVLTACGGGDGPPPPTPTPTLAISNYRLDSEPSLFITVSVLSDWIKTTEPGKVTYAPASFQNINLSVSTEKVSNLQPNATNLIEKRLSDIKAKAGASTQGQSESLNLLDREVSLNQVSYNNGQDVTELLTQVNIASANQAYLLSGLIPTAEFVRFKDPLRQMMSSMTFNPPRVTTAVPIISATPQITEGVAKANLITSAPNSSETKGSYLSFTNWTTPSLTGGQNAVVTLIGSFPARWQWAIKGFPNESDPGIYLNSPRPGQLGQSSSEATIHLGVVRGAFPAGTTTPDQNQWRAAYGKVFERFQKVLLPAFGEKVSIELPVDSDNLKKSDFTVRTDGDKQLIRSRGAIYFRNVGADMLVGVVYISPDASVVNSLVDSYEADLATMVKSMRIGNTR